MSEQQVPNRDEGGAPRPTARRAAAGAVALCVLIGAGVAGCTRAADQPEAQPAPRASTFQPGAFDELPSYPRSRPAGPASEKAGAVTQSFLTTLTSPETVVRWYAENLAPQGWAVDEAPHPSGTTAWQAVLQKGGKRLEVSAAPAPTVEDRGVPSPGEVDVQYSLVLR